MSKLWLIARREFWINVRRPGFLFGAFGVPIITGLIIVLTTSIQIGAEEDTARVGQVGYVDQAAVIAPSTTPPEFSAYADEASAEAALTSGAIGAYFVIAADYLQSGAVRVVGTSDIPDALLDQFSGVLLRSISSGVDAATLERLQDPVTLEITTLNNSRTVRDSGIIGLFIAPILFVMVFMIGSQTTSTYLMSGIVEEKTNRIMEILITSVTPFQLLAGKIIGLGLLGLLLLSIWVGGALIALAAAGNSGPLSGVSIPPDLIVIGLIYFVLTYFFIASLMAGIGAIFDTEQESRQFAGLVGLPLAIPFFLIIEFFTNPDGPIVTALTLIPLTAPVTVILRLGFGTIPVWQLAVSIGLLLLVTLFTVWASARIFRYSLLMYGKRPTPRELWRVLRGSTGGVMNTTATAEAKG